MPAEAQAWELEARSLPAQEHLSPLKRLGAPYFPHSSIGHQVATTPATTAISTLLSPWKLWGQPHDPGVSALDTLPSSGDWHKGCVGEGLRPMRLSPQCST
jgi:hypothetical protein